MAGGFAEPVAAERSHASSNCVVCVAVDAGARDGCLSVVTPSRVFTGPRTPRQGVEVKDIVAIQNGSEPNRYIVMTAHLNSRVTDVMNAGAEAPADSAAAGYRVYWRRTDAPMWQHSVWVGGVSSCVLKNRVIDNYFLGVASVSRDGFESPVVFPGAAGDFRDTMDTKGK